MKFTHWLLWHCAALDFPPRLLLAEGSDAPAGPPINFLIPNPFNVYYVFNIYYIILIFPVPTRLPSLASWRSRPSLPETRTSWQVTELPNRCSTRPQLKIVFYLSVSEGRLLEREYFIKNFNRNVIQFFTFAAILLGVHALGLTAGQNIQNWHYYRFEINFNNEFRDLSIDCTH